MASSKTKTAKNAGLMSIPAHTILLTFVSKLKENFHDALINGEKLPLEARNTLSVERLKGFQYTPDFQSLLSDKTLSTYYDSTYIMVISRGGTEIKTSLSTLTDSHKLYNWMLSNATKLYLLPHEAATGIIKDRNYSEICGQTQNTDISKAYINTSMTKSIKTDVKESKVLISMMVEKDMKDSPVRTLRTALQGMFTPAQVEAYKEQQKVLVQAKKNSKLISR